MHLELCLCLLLMPFSIAIHSPITNDALQPIDETIDWDSLQPIEDLSIFPNSPTHEIYQTTGNISPPPKETVKKHPRAHEAARQPEYRRLYGKQRRDALAIRDPEEFKRRKDRKNELRREARKSMTKEDKDAYLARKRVLNRLSDERLRLKSNIEKRIADGTATERDIHRLQHVREKDKMYSEIKRKARREAKAAKMNKNING